MRRFLFLTLIACMFASCRTAKVVTVTLHDTVDAVSVIRDSVYIDHFREVTKMNDTVYILDSMEVVRWMLRVDTVRDVREVGVPYEVEKVVEIEKPLSFWQQLMVRLGYVLLFGVVVCMGYLVWRKRFK